MSEQQTTVFIEIPPDVIQQEVWEVEQQLNLVETVNTELHEPKDIVTSTTLVVHIAIVAAATVTTLAAGSKTVYDVAKILFNFLHRMNKEQAIQEAKKKVILVKKGKRVELYNLSTEEIARILREQ